MKGMVAGAGREATSRLRGSMAYRDAPSVRPNVVAIRSGPRGPGAGGCGATVTTWSKRMSMRTSTPVTRV